MAPPKSTIPVTRGPSQPSELEPDPSGTRRVTVPASPRAQGRDPELLDEGTLAGQYQVCQVLGSGGGGIIYSARHRVLGRNAAVKVLRRDMATSPTMVARFEREATAVNTIRHPNIVDIYEFGELPDGRPFYVMELLNGTDLRKLLRIQGRYSPEEVLGVLDPVCQALDAAHRAGFVHRDLKASNIVVCGTGEDRVIKLVDFGIAKLLHPEPGSQGLTEAGMMLGTWHNMAPEQIRGEQIDHRADVYALGVLTYQLLTGQLPFTSDQRQDITWMHLTSPAPRPSHAVPMPTALDDVVLRCMEKDRERRYPTVLDFLADLRRACGHQDESASESAQAVAIYIELRTDEEELDDDLLEDMSNVLDSAEESLTENGFSLPIHTSNALLGAKVLPLENAELERTMVVDFAHQLQKFLARRAGAHPKLKIKVSVRSDEAAVRELEGRLEVSGGPLLEVEEWASVHDGSEVFVNDAFLVTLSEH